MWIPVAPTRELVSCYDEQREAAVIQELQNQLFSYRLVHFGKVKASDFDVPEFSGSIRGLGRTLGACIVEAPDLQACLVAHLQAHDEAVRLDRVSQIHSILVEALLVCCHERRSAVHVSEIADLANDILSRQGENSPAQCERSWRQIKDSRFWGRTASISTSWENPTACLRSGKGYTAAPTAKNFSLVRAMHFVHVMHLFL